MAIPEAQLDTWSHQGAVVTAQATHQSVRHALSLSATLAGKNYEVFLQGSYKNDTNIRGDSDVDIVVQYNGAWHYDLTALPPPQRTHYEQTYGTATYQWPHFRADVLAALRGHYGVGAITEGSNAITIAAAAGSGRLLADVIVALQFRKYLWFNGLNNEGWTEGIAFHHRFDNRLVINFPKPHYQRGVEKNAAHCTGGRYKPSVRMMKNARSRLVVSGAIADGLAPSYFVESLVFNVPDGLFTASTSDTYYKVVKWLVENDITAFVCQNGQVSLFGTTPEQWSTASAHSLLNALTSLWNNW